MSPRDLRGRLLLASVAVVASALAGEAFIRVVLKGRFETPVSERSLTYRYDATLGWFPQERSEKSFTGTRTIHVRHNARGFRDHEYTEKKKPRIAFLGDSFVWGYDAEADQRFTERLQERLPDHEVLNLGVSGYGTDQEYLLTQRVLPDLAPDVLVLVYSANDARDSSTNWRYGAYFKPYFEVEGGALVLRGVPVPKSLAVRYAEHPALFRSRLARAVAALGWKPRTDVLNTRDPTRALLRAEAELAASRKTRFAIASVESRASLQHFCAEAGIPFLDLSGAEQFPEVGHWTAAGHRTVAARLLAFLAELGWVRADARAQRAG